jgi:hypothetical protein
LSKPLCLAAFPRDASGFSFLKDPIPIAPALTYVPWAPRRLPAKRRIYTR